MKVYLALAVVPLAILGGCGSSEPAACGPGVNPVFAPGSVLPRVLHNEFQGTAEVGFTVERSGAVSHPRILATTFRPVGNASGTPVGYSDAILAAVEKWRFPVQPAKCYRKVKVGIQQSAAGA